MGTAKLSDNPMFSRIEAAAEDSGLTLRQLSDLCGFQRTHVYRWKRQNPSADSLRKIASITGANLHWLLTGEGTLRAGLRPERYPNRTKAVAAARALQVNEEAIEALLELDPGQDHPPAWWFDQLPLSNRRRSE